VRVEIEFAEILERMTGSLPDAMCRRDSAEILAKVALKPAAKLNSPRFVRPRRVTTNPNADQLAASPRRGSGI
jgi:hypothetical protein